MVAQGLVSEDRCTVSGAIKVAACRQMQRDATPLFANDRPIILYNPHFDHRLSSWQRFAVPLIEAISASDQFNLVVAPHIRMFEMASAAERAAWQARAVPGQVIIDLGSSRLNDMTYTNAADIYVGDVSSQVYEFLTVAKPCVFIDAHGVNWRDNPDYAMWQFGPVCTVLDQLVDSLAKATKTHSDYIAVQRRMVADALGDSGDRAADVAAEQLVSALNRFSQPA